MTPASENATSGSNRGSLKGHVTQTFLRGLSIVIPVAVTAYVIYWIGSIFDAVLVYLLKKLGVIEPDNGANLYGLGILAALVLVFLVGLFTRGLIGRGVHWLERIVQKVPVIGGLYGALKDMMGMFGGDPAKSFSKVVLVKIPDSDMTTLGLVTRQDFSKLPQVDEGDVAVYVPMSYQMGGFTFMVPRDQLVELDMTAEAGMQFALTAAMSLHPRVKRGSSQSDEDPNDPPGAVGLARAPEDAPQGD